jgi:hypothetical protein
MSSLCVLNYASNSANLFYEVSNTSTSSYTYMAFYLANLLREEAVCIEFLLGFGPALHLMDILEDPWLRYIYPLFLLFDILSIPLVLLL